LIVKGLAIFVKRWVSSSTFSLSVRLHASLCPGDDILTQLAYSPNDIIFCLHQEQLLTFGSSRTRLPLNPILI